MFSKRGWVAVVVCFYESAGPVYVSDLSTFAEPKSPNSVAKLLKKSGLLRCSGYGCEQLGGKVKDRLCGAANLRRPVKD